MKITYRGDYAVKAVLDLAIHYGEGAVPIHDLAKRADIPIKFLEQILLELKKGGFVESRRGNVGGYLLAKPPARIVLGQIIRFIDGPVEPIACVAQGYSACRDISRCVLKRIWQEVALATTAVIDTITLEDLANQVKAQGASPTYQI